MTMTALLCEQILPVHLDISHVLRCEVFVAFAALDFLIETVQGPCLKNQRIIEGNERFMSTLTRWSLSKVSIESESLAVLAGKNRFSSTIQRSDSSMLDSVDFFPLKLMKNKCLILRLGLLEGRKWTENCSHLKAMYNKYIREDCPRARLECIYQEYRIAKKLGRQAGLPPERGRKVYQLIRSEAHLTLSYYTALKRWMPSAQERIIPQSMEVVRRKQIGSDVEYRAAQRKYRKLEKYKRIYSSYMDRQRNIEVFWLDKGLFQLSFQKPRQVPFLFTVMSCVSTFLSIACLSFFSVLYH